MMIDRQHRFSLRETAKKAHKASQLALFACLLLLTTHCATSKSGLDKLRQQNQSSIYTIQEASNPDMQASRDQIQQDFRHTLDGLLHGNVFDQRSWGRSCDCL